MSQRWYSLGLALWLFEQIPPRIHFSIVPKKHWPVKGAIDLWGSPFNRTNAFNTKEDCRHHRQGAFLRYYEQQRLIGPPAIPTYSRQSISNSLPKQLKHDLNLLADDEQQLSAYRNTYEKQIVVGFNLLKLLQPALHALYRYFIVYTELAHNQKVRYETVLLTNTHSADEVMVATETASWW